MRGQAPGYSHMNMLYGENRFYRHVASHWIFRKVAGAQFEGQAVRAVG